MTGDTISLDELNGVAALQSRVDRKYLLDNDALQRLVGGLADGARLLEIDGQSQFNYSSVYFDTPDHALYLAAAYGRRRRFKVRTRHYEDSGLCLLEVKQKARGRTVKTRLPYKSTDRQQLTSPGLAHVSSVTEQPAICDPAATGPDHQIPAPDVGPSAKPDPSHHRHRPPLHFRHVGYRLVEHGGGLKQRPPAPPVPADRLLWSFGIRPVRISKFGTGAGGPQSPPAEQTGGTEL